MGIFDKYEDLNMNCYTSNSPDQMVLNNPESKSLKDQMSHMIANQKNPFEEMYHWCKGEIHDIQAIMAAIAQKDAFDKLLKKTETKKQNQQADLEHVNQGKKTIRTMFKSEKDANSMMSSIESSEKDLENLGVLIDIVSIYLGEQVIP
jgi:sorting nexin-1/2